MDDPETPTAGRYDPFAPIATRHAGQARSDPLALGPLDRAYLIWLAGASCEGCTVAATGGTHPRLEQLQTGAIPGLPRVELVHPLLATEAGDAFIANLSLAAAGRLGAPYVLVWEGSVVDEASAGDGYWCGLGEDATNGEQLTSLTWLDRLAPGAAAVVAVGTCAAWGGVPAAKGNVTGARSVEDHLGSGFRSAAGVPLVRIPGCSPLGDNVTETLAALLLHLNGLAPLPELDELGRPAWLFSGTVHASCPRAGYYDAGVFAVAGGSDRCLVELGCWGPVVQCNIAERGVIDGHGGCMALGGICIGCTMPGFPDRFAPFFGRPDLTSAAPVATRVEGGFLRRLRVVRGRHRRSDGGTPPAVVRRRAPDPAGARPRSPLSLTRVGPRTPRT